MQPQATRFILGDRSDLETSLPCDFSKQPGAPGPAGDTAQKCRLSPPWCCLEISEEKRGTRNAAGDAVEVTCASGTFSVCVCPGVCEGTSVFWDHLIYVSL